MAESAAPAHVPPARDSARSSNRLSPLHHASLVDASGPSAVTHMTMPEPVSQKPEWSPLPPSLHIMYRVYHVVRKCTYIIPRVKDW